MTSSYYTEKRKKKKPLQFQFFAGWGNNVFFQKSNGELWASGKGKRGELSLGTLGKPTGIVLKPLRVIHFKPRSKMQILHVSPGEQHTLFLTRCGAFSSGYNRNGRLSDSTLEDRDPAVRVVLERENVHISQVVAGLASSFFITRSGFVFSAGYGGWGETGHGLCTSVVRGKQIRNLSGIVKIITGNHWTIFMSRSNRLFGCGLSGGQFCIGNENFGNLLTPTEITYFKNRNIHIESMVSCLTAAYFITREKQVWVSGSSNLGQFGNGFTGNRYGTPEAVEALSGHEVFCTGNSACFVVFKKRGKCYGTGYESIRYGVTIDGGRSGERYVVTEISSLQERDVIQIVTRFGGSYALLADGTVLAAGVGKFGALMNGARDDLSQFVEVGKFDLMVSDDDDLIGDFGRRERILFLCSVCSVYSSSILII